MQPDGTLNPSAEPVELPDPSDSGPSYWLARTIWALGEAYPAFLGRDPAFAGFLRDRLDLALRAVERQVLVRYGQWLDIDGVAVPAWLIVDGADALGDGESACKRDPVAASRRPVAIHLCGLPGGCPEGRTGRPCLLLGLAPGGVYRAARVTPDAGALLPHRFTLTCGRSPGPSAVCSLLH
jgi:hypothetical protein